MLPLWIGGGVLLFIVFGFTLFNETSTIIKNQRAIIELLKEKEK